MWDGDRYQQRFDDLAAAGIDVHGEAHLVASVGGSSVLDAGCGTGRVAAQLARWGWDAVGVDNDTSMLASARRLDVAATWVEADLASLELGRTFDVVVLAGNVMLFTAPGTEAAVVAGCARHVDIGGTLIAGFGLDRHYGVADYDRHCADAGLVLHQRFATWDRHPWPGDGGYAVSLHRHHGA